jgi:hypothetical protein
MKWHKDIQDARAMRKFESLEEDFHKVHKSKYDYSNVIYLKGRLKVDMVCSEHGAFEQSPTSHLRGVGCPKCGRAQTEVGNKRKSEKSKKNFVARATHVHSNLYTYDEVKYEGYDKKVKITCNKHGVFHTK